MRSYLLSPMYLPVVGGTSTSVQPKQLVQTAFRATTPVTAASATVSNGVREHLPVSTDHPPSHLYLPCMQIYAFPETRESARDGKRCGQAGFEYRRRWNIHGPWSRWAQIGPSQPLIREVFIIVVAICRVPSKAILLGASTVSSVDQSDSCRSSGDTLGWRTCRNLQGNPPFGRGDDVDDLLGERVMASAAASKEVPSLSILDKT